MFADCGLRFGQESCGAGYDDDNDNDDGALFAAETVALDDDDPSRLVRIRDQKVRRMGRPRKSALDKR